MSLPDLTRIKGKDFKRIAVEVDKFGGGVNTLFSSTRLKSNEAVEATNLMLSDDGTWTKRWGTQYYGTDAGGSIVDGFAEYRASDGTRELIIFANDLARKSTDDGNAWTTISGYTPTAGTPVYSIQVGDYLYACNGTDSLARYDGSTFATYTALTEPTNLAGARTTLNDGDYDYYCFVTAHNEVGETGWVAAKEASLGVDKPREEWSGTDKITWTWDQVSGATKYSVYLYDQTGYKSGKVAEVTGAMTSPSWADDGSASINDLIAIPNSNTTGGPKFKYLCVSGNRLWGTGDPDNPWTVYFSGRAQRIGQFDFAYGGGWIELEKGGKATTSGIIDYQGLPHIFCSTPEGKGTIWSISLSLDTTYGTALSFWDPTPTKITGRISSLAPRAIVQVENDVFFLTKRGVYVLGNEPNILSDVLRTNELSAKIRPYIDAITTSNLEKTCAYYYDAKVFFSTPTRTFVYDRERTCWLKDWSVGAAQLGEYTDTDDVTHFLGGMPDDGYLIEFGENYQGDLGVAFSTSYLSPRFSISKDWRGFGWMDKAYTRLGEPEGSINVEILGTQKGESFSSVVTGTITPGISNAGLGWDQLGSYQLGDSAGTPTTFRATSLVRYLSVNKRLSDIQYHLTTSTLAAKYTLLGYQVEGRLVPTALPLDWKLS